MSSLIRYGEIQQSPKIDIFGQTLLCDNGCNLKIGYRDIKNIILVCDTQNKSNLIDNPQKVFYIKFNKNNQIDNKNDTFIEWNGTKSNGFGKSFFYLKEIFFFIPQRNRENKKILNNGIEINIVFSSPNDETILNLSILGQVNDSNLTNNSKTNIFFNTISEYFPSVGQSKEINIKNFNINWLFPENNSFYNVNLNEGKINLVLFANKINIPSSFYNKYKNYIYSSEKNFNTVFNNYSSYNIINPAGTLIFFNKNVKISGKIYCDKDCNMVYTGNTENLEVINSKSFKNNKTDSSNEKNNESISEEKNNEEPENKSSNNTDNKNISDEKPKDNIKKCKNDSTKVLTPTSTIIMIVFGIILFLLLVYYIFKLSTGELCSMYKPLLYFLCISLFVLSVIFLVLLSITSYKKSNTNSNKKNFSERNKMISTMWTILFVIIFNIFFLIIHLIMCSKNNTNTNSVLLGVSSFNFDKELLIKILIGFIVIIYLVYIIFLIILLVKSKNKNKKNKCDNSRIYKKNTKNMLQFIIVISLILLVVSLFLFGYIIFTQYIANVTKTKKILFITSLIILMISFLVPIIILNKKIYDNKKKNNCEVTKDFKALIGLNCTCFVISVIILIFIIWHRLKNNSFFGSSTSYLINQGSTSSSPPPTYQGSISSSSGNKNLLSYKVNKKIKNNDLKRLSKIL